jgi:hypothetical protein
LETKSLEKVACQASHLDRRLVFGCGIGYSQNRIMQNAAAIRQKNVRQKNKEEELFLYSFVSHFFV